MSDGDEPREGRLARHRRIAREIYTEPRSAGTHVRASMLAVWTRHGAGFYGLGWLITFIVLEITLFTGELSDSDGIFEFVGGQMIEYLLRVGIMSFVNGLLASIWPVYVLQWLGGYGILVLVAGYFAFEKLLRPGVEACFPELAVARQQAAEAAAARKARKAARKQARQSGEEPPDA